jgi:hypothetical protein
VNKGCPSPFGNALLNGRISSLIDKRSTRRAIRTCGKARRARSGRESAATRQGAFRERERCAGPGRRSPRRTSVRRPLEAGAPLRCSCYPPPVTPLVRIRSPPSDTHVVAPLRTTSPWGCCTDGQYLAHPLSQTGARSGCSRVAHRQGSARWGDRRRCTRREATAAWSVVGGSAGLASSLRRVSVAAGVGPSPGTASRTAGRASPRTISCGPAAQDRWLSGDSDARPAQRRPRDPEATH